MAFAFLDNVTTVLLVAPLVLQVCRQLGCPAPPNPVRRPLRAGIIDQIGSAAVQATKRWFLRHRSPDRFRCARCLRGQHPLHGGDAAHRRRPRGDREPPKPATIAETSAAAASNPNAKVSVKNSATPKATAAMNHTIHK
jgi:hypothetical protein